MDEELPGNLAAEILLKFGDGQYLFALKLKQIEELQRKCRAGLGEIVQRVWTSSFYVADIVETIRLGLIGGGIPPHKAMELIETYVDGHPLVNESDPSCPYAVARATLGAVYFGVRVAMEEHGDGGDEEEEESEGKVEAVMGMGVASMSRPTTDKDLFSGLPPSKSGSTASVNGSAQDLNTTD